MKAIRLPSGSVYYAQEHNALRSDAAISAMLHVHQQLGALALGTTPSNNQTITFDINGTNVVFNAVTGTPTNPGDVKAPGTAVGFVANLYAALINPTVSTSTFIALSSANAILVQYLGWGLASGGTTITPFSLNTSTYAPLTSFSSSTTVTSGAWTAQTMQLYVQPGTYYVGTTRILFLGGSTPTFTAPSSHPRIDLVTADSSGTIALITGTEASSPSVPSYPPNKLVLAEIMHVVGETALYDNDNQQTGQGYVLNDVRPGFAPPYLNSTSQAASGLFIPDPGSEAQGDVLYYNGAAWARLPAGTAGYHLATGGPSANPSWAIDSMGHQVQDLSQPSKTDTSAGSFQSIATYTSFPALLAGQSLLIRMTIHCALTFSVVPTDSFQITLNGTAITLGGAAMTLSATDAIFDVLVSVANASNLQYLSGHSFMNVQGFFPIVGSIAANVSSPFTIAVQEQTSGGSGVSNVYTISLLDIFIIN